MPLTWSSSAQQVSNITSTATAAFAGGIVNISLSTQGFANGGTIYYSTTGSGVQSTGTAIVTNYFGDLGTATLPIVTSRSTSTSAFTITFYTGSLSGIQISNPLQPATLSASDPYFTATVLLLSPAGIGSPALSDISGTTGTINVFGSPQVRSFIPFTTPNISSSISFKGSSDYLLVGPSASYGFGTGDFTVEFWYYATVNNRQDWLDINGAGTRLLVYFNGTNIAYSPANVDQITGAAMTLNSWQHVALCRISGSTKLYINGTQSGSTYASDTTNFPTQSVYIGKDGGGSTFVTGYMSNIRLVKGLGVYTGTFTPPAGPLQATQSAGTNISAITAGQTVLLLAQSAQSPNNNSYYDLVSTLTQVSYVGTPTQGTFSPFSQYATYYNGSASYLSLNSSPNFAFGTGDFTFECWANLGGSTTGINLYESRSTQFGNGLNMNIRNADQIPVYRPSGTDQIVGSYALNLNTWYHIAYVRISGVTKMYVNGVQSGSSFTDTQNIAANNIRIGANYASSSLSDGYIRNFRIIKGQGLYTGNFTPPSLTSQLTVTTNTVLLACQGPFGTTSTDYSTITNVVNTIGTISTRLISSTTFLTSQYSSSTIGGSVFFSGGDYLTTTATGINSVVNFGTGNFTVDLWFNVSKLGVNQSLFDTRFPNVADAGFDISISNTNQMRLSTNATFYITGSTAIGTNQWYHVAVVRESTTVIKMYLNGVQEGSTYTASASQNFINTTATIANGQNGYFTGFISGVRAIKGYAAYTGNFSPSLSLPAALLTGTTSILIGNNASIYDSTGFNNIAIVGTATITTAAVKFGSSSMLFAPPTDSSYLSINTSTNANPALQFGTAPFTIEAWIQLKSASLQKVIYDTRTPDNSNAGFDFYVNSSNQLSFGTQGVSYIVGTTTLSVGLWYHVAVVRESLTVMKMYLNGFQEGSTYTASVSQNFTNYITKIGSGVNGNFNGYISDLRVTRFARYTGNFTTATSYSPLI